MSGGQDPWRDALFVIPPPPVVVDLDAVMAANAERADDNRRDEDQS